MPHRHLGIPLTEIWDVGWLEEYSDTMNTRTEWVKENPVYARSPQVWIKFFLPQSEIKSNSSWEIWSMAWTYILSIVGLPSMKSSKYCSLAGNVLPVLKSSVKTLRSMSVWSRLKCKICRVRLRLQAQLLDLLFIMQKWSQWRLLNRRASLYYEATEF